MKQFLQKKHALWISLFVNILLFALVIFIGCIKTDYINNKLEKIGIMKFEHPNPGDYKCIQGWANTIEKLHLDMDIVFFGNSITQESSFETYFPNVKILNLGYPGNTIDGMLYRIDQIKAVNPKKVFVMAGINGLPLQTYQEFTEKYTSMVDSIKQIIPTAKIYLQSILPVNTSMKNGTLLKEEKFAKSIEEKIANCNKIIESIAKQKGCVYINLYKLYAIDSTMPKELTRDGVHLYPEAYDKWAKEIKKYIEE